MDHTSTENSTTLKIQCTYTGKVNTKSIYKFCTHNILYYWNTVTVTTSPIKPSLTDTVEHKDAATLPYAVGNACVETESSAVRM